MRHHHYKTDDGHLLRITTKYARPNVNYARGVWTVQEWWPERGWEMPSFPEITWGTLKKLEYLGSTKVEDK